MVHISYFRKHSWFYSSSSFSWRMPTDISNKVSHYTFPFLLNSTIFWTYSCVGHLRLQNHLFEGQYKWFWLFLINGLVSFLKDNISNIIIISNYKQNLIWCTILCVDFFACTFTYCGHFVLDHTSSMQGIITAISRSPNFSITINNFRLRYLVDFT